jgi:hypothetical protein
MNVSKPSLRCELASVSAHRFALPWSPMPSAPSIVPITL